MVPLLSFPCDGFDTLGVKKRLSLLANKDVPRSPLPKYNYTLHISLLLSKIFPAGGSYAYVAKVFLLSYSKSEEAQQTMK